MQRKWLISARRYLVATLALFMVVSLFPASFVVEAAAVITEDNLVSSEQDIEAHLQSVQMQVERMGGSSGHTIVEFKTSDGTAKAGIDYPRTAGVLAFNSGETSNTAPADPSYRLNAEVSLEPHYDYKVADFTNDGIADIVYMNQSAELIILKGIGSYKYTELSRQRLPHHGVQLLTGDWNGDGLMDVTAFEGNLHVYKNKGSNTFEKIKEIHNSTTPKAADFNGDGYDDIVTSHWGSDVFVYYGDAQGSFDSNPYRFTPANGVYEIHLVELNKDSHMDFVLVYVNGVEVIVNDGKGGFQPQGVFDGGMMWLGSRYLMEPTPITLPVIPPANKPSNSSLS